MLEKRRVGRVDGAQAVAVQVEAAMRALMPFADGSREQAARIADLSERKLQPRLAEAGASFQALRGRMRADIVLKSLRQSGLQAGQIAGFLGCAEPAVSTHVPVRGVMDADAAMANSVMRGAFLQDASPRRELLDLVKREGA